MKHLFRSRWTLGLGVFALTAVSYAQWSNPAEDVPAYHPSAPLKVSCAPANTFRIQAHGRQISDIPGRSTFTSRLLRSAAWFISFPAIAVAIGPLVTPACAVVLRVCTGPSAPPAPRKAFLPISRPSWARSQPRSEPPLRGTTTKRSIWKSSRNWPVQPIGIRHRIERARTSCTGSHLEALWDHPIESRQMGASRFRRDRLRLRRHVGVWAPVIARKTKVANDNLALAA